MQIRPIRPDEHEALAAITVEAYRRLQGGRPLGPYEDELRAVPARAADSVVLVAVDGSEVLGGVTYVPDTGRAMSEFSDPEGAGVRTLAVRPQRQGEGIGRALMQACIEAARADGRARIILHSTEVMEVARKMYAAMGFVETPTLDEWVSTSGDGGEPDLRLIAFVLEL